MESVNNQTPKKSHRKLLFVLIPIALVMFGFAFAQVPMFRLFCQKIGLGMSPNTNVEETEGGREIKVIYTGTVAGDLKVFFKPKYSVQTVNLGKKFENEYKFINMSDDTVYFRPVHSILPEDASKKFNMTKCFCFDDQTLAPNEEATRYLTGLLSTDLDDDISQVTLHYTLFAKDKNDLETGREIPNIAVETGKP